MSEEELNRPFDADLLFAASVMADNYLIKIEPNEELGFVGHGMKFPTVFGDGKTEEECRKNVREAIVASIALMLESGQEEFIPD